MSSKLSRREFIGASAGVAVAASLGGASVTLGGGRPTIPPGLLGVQQFSVRDATARLSIASSNRLGLTPAMGFLGGPDYPGDPSDLGPLVPLPGGYAEVFEYLASVDVKSFEFFQSTQDARELGRAAYGRRDPGVPRCGRLEGGRDPPVRARQPRPGDRQPHGERRDATSSS